MSKLTKSICTRITEDEYVAVHNQVEYFGLGSVNDLIRAYIQTALCFSFDYGKFFDVAKDISAVGDTNDNAIAQREKLEIAGTKLLGF